MKTGPQQRSVQATPVRKAEALGRPDDSLLLVAIGAVAVFHPVQPRQVLAPASDASAHLRNVLAEEGVPRRAAGLLGGVGRVLDEQLDQLMLARLLLALRERVGDILDVVASLLLQSQHRLSLPRSLEEAGVPVARAELFRSAGGREVLGIGLFAERGGEVVRGLLEGPGGRVLARVGVGKAEVVSREAAGRRARALRLLPLGFYLH